MSRDRLLTFDRLFSSGTHTDKIGNDNNDDDEQISPETEMTALDDSMRANDKDVKPVKANGYLNASSHLKTR